MFAENVGKNPVLRSLVENGRSLDFCQKSLQAFCTVAKSTVIYSLRYSNSHSEKSHIVEGIGSLVEACPLDRMRG